MEGMQHLMSAFLFTRDKCNSMSSCCILEGVAMECRAGCAACCICISISSPIPGMPEGKPAGIRCVQLTADNLCMLFGNPERPSVCVSLKPSKEMCGEINNHAHKFLTNLEKATTP